jgi:hypothetical protein
MTEQLLFNEEDSPTTTRRGPYSKINPTIRARFITYVCEEKVSVRSAAIVLGLNPATAQPIWSRYTRTGNAISGQRGGSSKIKGDNDYCGLCGRAH